VASVFCVKLFSLGIVLATFGTAGVFFPLFTLGALFGYCLGQWILPEATDFFTTWGMLGGSAILGAVLGVPLSGAILAYELTGNLTVVLPSVVASWGAVQICRSLSTPSLIEQDLDSRSIQLLDGKTKKILEAVTAAEAMATDFEVADEHESVSVLYEKVRQAKYPFIPVVNSRQEFLGLLTVDVILEGFQTQAASGGASPLAVLMEAKDLLYRSKSQLQSQFVWTTDSLAATTGFFNDVPCVPVLGIDKTVQGLLFVYHVRVAYDRETLRRSTITEAG
jgi:hypothetical protein